MPIPQTEQEIIGLLKLDQYGDVHPVPSFNSEEKDITIFDNKEFTNEAIAAALNAITDEALIDLLQYPHNIFSHNNIAGHTSAGGELELPRILKLATIGETRQRIKKLMSTLKSE
jgi:hypothetical protein